MVERLVHIIDDAEVVSDAGDLTMVCVLTGFLDAGKAAELAATHLAELSDGKVVATFDVDSLHDYRARRPPVTFVRDHYIRLRGSPPGRARPARHRRDAVPAAAGARAGHPLGGLRPRRARGGRALRRRPRGDPRCRPDGRAAHAADRDHAPRQPTRAGHRGEPVAGRAAGPGQCAVAVGDPAGGVGPGRARLRRPHPALPRPDGIPPGRPQPARAASSWAVASPST